LLINQRDNTFSTNRSQYSLKKGERAVGNKLEKNEKTAAKIIKK